MDIILFVPVIKDINEYKREENHYIKIFDYLFTFRAIKN